MSWHHEGSRHERGYGWEWVKLRKRILDRDMHLCQPCRRKGRVTEAREVDHIVPKAQDGTDDHENLEAICTPCHKAKTQAERQGARRVTFGEDGWPVG
jgi:5-methylcytosine-specific restriction protein A